MDRLQLIRQKEKEYHDEAYKQFELFQPGSWLHKPVQTIMELLVHFKEKDELRVLDLGCGVGRNSIPIAQSLEYKPGEVVAVDLLESAVAKLQSYSRQYGVEDRIRPVLSDISAYPIAERYFDLIFSVSALEHLDSEANWSEVIKRMKQGTKPGGLNAIIMSTSVRETVEDTGDELDPMYELMFSTESLLQKLEGLYAGWEVLKQTVKPYAVQIKRDGRAIKLESDVVTWVVQRTGA
ncbi:hypothetical protein AWM70_06065 [Paenibacillus yonginensis]|uniref:Methyltransferase domain-containing protein n=2 Tax=Paenibacillus yonginensis TaxID=1462996 RepID=A0A1B1MYD9_9BACL|nr:hypothetical protein AWM70_06065 [Paenibacillus yonginensis]